MNGQTKSPSGLTDQTKALMGLVGIFIVISLILPRFLKQSQATPIPEPTSPGLAAATATSPSPSQSGPVKIQIVTTNTKFEWLDVVTKDFNASGAKTAAGRPIQVEVVQVEGPDDMKQRLEAGLKGAVPMPVLLSPGDISWMESVNEFLKAQGQPEVVSGQCPPVVAIPTGFTMWRPMAEALGWPGNPISWQQIVDLAADPQGWTKYGHPEWGQFTFGHSHPDGSTTGFNLLASLAYAATGKTEGLTTQDVRSDQVKDAFRKLELNTYRYGLSTKNLLTPMAKGGPAYLHAASTSETAFIASVTKYQSDDLKRLGKTLAFIFPAEGVFWSDNPTCILKAKGVTDEQGEAAAMYRTYLLAPPAQEKAVEIGLRPVTPGIALKDPISLATGTDPDAPKKVPRLANVSGDTRDAIIDVFKETKKKATVVVLLDTSTSMNDGNAIKNATAGADEFLKRLAPDDDVFFYTFNDDVKLLSPGGRAGDVVEQLSVTVANLFGDGNTALYDAVCMGMDTIGRLRDADQKAGARRLYAVVLLSDGMDSGASKTWRSESAMTSCLPEGEDVQLIPIYTIAYGDKADKELLTRIANRTKGRALEATPENIKAVYQSISAEQ